MVTNVSEWLAAVADTFLGPRVDIGCASGGVAWVDSIAIPTGPKTGSPIGDVVDAAGESTPNDSYVDL